MGDGVGIRDQQKQATRQKVLDAAKALFDDVGYDETTIRAIAQRAGVSVGSVFTTFSSKADILGQIMRERMIGLRAELERVIPHLRGSTCDQVSSLLAIQYSFQMRHPKLFLAYLGASFAPEHSAEFTPFGQNLPLSAPALDVLKAAQSRGDIRADVDLLTVMDLITGIYGVNYLRVSRGADAEALSKAADAQLAILFDGLKPGRPA